MTMDDRDYIEEERREAAKWAECSREGHVGEAFDRAHKHNGRTATRAYGRSTTIGGVNVGKIVKVLVIISVIIVLLSVVAGFAISALASRSFDIFNEEIDRVIINGNDILEDFPDFDFGTGISKSISIFGCVIGGFVLVCAMWVVFGIVMLILSTVEADRRDSSGRM